MCRAAAGRGFLVLRPAHQPSGPSLETKGACLIRAGFRLLISRHKPEGTYWSPPSTLSTGAAEKPQETTSQGAPLGGGEGYVKAEETIPGKESFFSGCQLTEPKAGETCTDIKSFAGENRSRRPYAPDLGVGCGIT